MCNTSLFDRIIKNEVTEIQGIRVITGKKTNDMTSVCGAREKRESGRKMEREIEWQKDRRWWVPHLHKG